VGAFATVLTRHVPIFHTRLSFAITRLLRCPTLFPYTTLFRSAGGQFVVNGVAQTGGHEIDVSPANVANTVFDAGTSAGTDTLYALRMPHDCTPATYQPLTPTFPSPTLSVSSIASATKGQVSNF